MTSINDRIREIRTDLKLSQREFSQKIQITQSHYSDMESGKILPKERYLTLISSKFGVNFDWLKTGKGQKFNSKPDLRLEYLVDIFKQLDHQLQDVVLDHLKKLLKVQKEMKK